MSKEFPEAFEQIFCDGDCRLGRILQQKLKALKSVNKPEHIFQKRDQLLTSKVYIFQPINKFLDE